MSSSCAPGEGPTLCALPDLCLATILSRLDGRSLARMEAVSSYFSRPLLEGLARRECFRRCANSRSEAERFRYRSWRERLHLEEATGVGFDRAWSEAAGFAVQFTPAASGGDTQATLQAVRLHGMGPKLLLSDRSTADQPTIRWRLRVKGNTAVEFGVIPVALEPTHTSLHKCQATPDCADHRAQGFCSQITAGSLLPLKAPVMRGTVLDVMACRGRLEVVLTYSPEAKEIIWQNGQPIQKLYRGPSQLRFEQEFSPDYDVRLAVTSWAKAHFEVLHSTAYPLDPEWAADVVSAEAAHVAAVPAEPLAQPEVLAAAGFDDPEEQGMVLLGGMLQAFQQPQPLVPDAAFAAGVDHLPAAAAAAAGQAEGDELLPAPEEEVLAALLADPAVAAAPAVQPAMPAVVFGGAAAAALAPGSFPALAMPAAAAAEAGAGAAATALTAAVQLDSAGLGEDGNAASNLCPLPSGELLLDGHLC